MASNKKNRKRANAARKLITGPVTRHPDGDRRRRGGLTADQALADKQARQSFPGIPEDANPDSEKS